MAEINENKTLETTEEITETPIENNENIETSETEEVTSKKKKKEKNLPPQNKPLKIIGIVLSVLEIVVIAALGLTIYSMDLIPVKWVIVLVLVILIFAVVIISNMLKPAKKKSGNVRKVIAIICALMFICGNGALTAEVMGVKKSLNNIPNTENIIVDSETEKANPTSNDLFTVLFCSYDDSILALEMVNTKNHQILSVSIPPEVLSSTTVADRLVEIETLLGVKTSYYVKVDLGNFDSLVEEIMIELNIEEVLDNPEEMITTESVMNAITTVVFKHADELIKTASNSLSTNLTNDKLSLIAKSFIGGENAYDTKNVAIVYKTFDTPNPGEVIDKVDEQSVANVISVIEKFQNGQLITDEDINFGEQN